MNLVVFVVQETGPFHLGYRIWGLELFGVFFKTVLMSMESVVMPVLSFRRLQFVSSLLFFLAYQLFKINFVDYFKESVSGFVDFLSCFSVFSFIDIDFCSLVFIISFLLLALGLS